MVGAHWGLIKTLVIIYDASHFESWYNICVPLDGQLKSRTRVGWARKVAIPFRICQNDKMNYASAGPIKSCHSWKIGGNCGERAKDNLNYDHRKS